MGDKTGIEWTDATWNAVTGCTKVSAGCDRCYAETLAERFRGTPGHYYENGFDVQLRPDKLTLPLRWTKPRRVFVNSMSDLFHEQIPDLYIAKVFAVMAHAERHTFQVLTKRHARMRSLLSSEAFRELVFKSVDFEVPDVMGDAWPLPNVWLGVSTEDQKWADIRIRVLLGTPAAVRFVSAEPLLGPIDLTKAIEPNFAQSGWKDLSRLDWVIVGGESGRGARPMHPDWARSLRDQCTDAGVPFLFKQWGEWSEVESAAFSDIFRRASDHLIWTDGAHVALSDAHRMPINDGAFIRRVGKKAAGRDLDGRTWDEYPEAERG